MSREAEPAEGTGKLPARALVVAGALAAIAGALLAAGPFAAPYANPDSHTFEALARSLLAGRGLVYREVLLPDVDLFAFRSPVYAAFLAATLPVGGTALTLALQGALAGVTAALVGAIAGLLAGRRAAWVAFALAVAWPPAWFFAGQLLSETLYTFLAVAAAFLCCRAAAGAPGGAAWGGALASLAALTRSQGALAVPAMALAAFRRHPRALLAFGLAALLVWAPWPIRNAVHLHRFVPLLTSGGMNAWLGATGAPIPAAWDLQATWGETDEVSIDRRFYAEARTAVAAAPLAWVKGMARRAARHVLPVESDAWTLLHRAIWPLALLAAAHGATRRRLAIPFSVWAGNAVIAIAFLTNSRYRFPTEWVVVVAAAAGFDALARRHGTARAAGASVLLAAGFLAIGQWMRRFG